ncbi:hypothetical protein Efla_007679 [Eimeria flavescens]
MASSGIGKWKSGQSLDVAPTVDCTTSPSLSSARIKVRAPQQGSLSPFVFINVCFVEAWRGREARSERRRSERRRSKVHKGRQTMPDIATGQRLSKHCAIVRRRAARYEWI